MSLVIKLDRHEQPVRLRVPGFESCIVTAPGWLSDMRLAQQYRRPWRVDISGFVDGLLAACLHPACSPAQVRALPVAARASLRRALVVACDCERDWLALYGSHLYPDERLFALMYWRWQRQDKVFKRQRAERQAQMAKLRVGVGADIYAKLGLTTKVTAVPSALGLALQNVSPKVDFAQMLPPTTVSAVQALETQAKVGRELSKRFETPLTGGVLDHMSKMNSLTKVFDGVQAISRVSSLARMGAFTTGALSPFASARIDTSVSALMTGSVSANMTKVAGMAKRMGWSAPAGLAGMVSSWERTSVSAAAVAGLGVEVPALTEMFWGGQLAKVFEATQKLQRLTEPMRELTEAVETVDKFDRRWQNEALYFIVSGFLTVCGLWEMRKLAVLSRDEVEEAVLLSLEAVARDGQFIAALRTEVSRAPYINSSQRTNLDHALEHAAHGEYVHACASLYWGLEGAFWEVGYAKLAVTLQRTDPKNPNRSIGFETMVKRLGLGQEMKTFMVRGLYGTAGNPYRHGGADSGERRQVLLGIAALAGWFEHFTNAQALTELVTRTGQALPGAVEQVLESARLLGP